MAFFSQSRTVLFQEVDAAGIVFFARFFEWFHDAYAAGLAARGIRFEKVFAESPWGLPLVHAEADYKEPLGYGAPFRVDVETVVAGDSSITVTYAVRGGIEERGGAERRGGSPPGGRTADQGRIDGMKLHATGKTVHVCIDRATFRAIPLPDELRSALG